jgi:glycosyltransferase involved in cell wall biosynthesis
MWPTLAIVIITYNRRDVLRETLRRLNTHLAYDGPRALVIADDGSDDGTAEMLAEYPDAVHVVSSRCGLGVNANAGVRAALACADYVF